MPRKTWLPPVDSGKPLDVADLSDMIPGPDPRFQTHGPGCRCGDGGCPWYRGERAREIYRDEMTPQQRQEADSMFAEAMRTPIEWQIRDSLLQAARPRRGWLGWFRR